MDNGLPMEIPLSALNNPVILDWVVDNVHPVVKQYGRRRVLFHVHLAPN